MFVISNSGEESARHSVGSSTALIMWIRRKTRMMIMKLRIHLSSAYLQYYLSAEHLSSLIEQWQHTVHGDYIWKDLWNKMTG